MGCSCNLPQQQHLPIAHLNKPGSKQPTYMLAGVRLWVCVLHLANCNAWSEAVPAGTWMLGAKQERDWEECNKNAWLYKAK